MNTLLKNFLHENEDREELLDNLKLNKDKQDFENLLDEFNSYLFKMYAVSYIKNTVQKKAIDIKKNIFKQIKKNNEELILSSDPDDSSKYNIDNLQDESDDFVETIINKGCDFKGIISDKELLASIESLTDKQKEVLFLLFIKNLDEKSIAHERHVSIQSVNKVKLKALNHLRADWGCKHGKCS